MVVKSIKVHLGSPFGNLASLQKGQRSTFSLRVVQKKVMFIFISPPLAPCDIQGGAKKKIASIKHADDLIHKQCCAPATQRGIIATKTLGHASAVEGKRCWHGYCY